MPVIVLEHKLGLVLLRYHGTSLHEFLDFHIFVLGALSFDVGHILAEDLELVMLAIETLNSIVVVPVICEQDGSSLFHIVIEVLSRKLLACRLFLV